MKNYTDTIKLFSPNDLKLLWAKIDKQSPDQCWLWKGSTNQGGYGLHVIKIGGKKRLLVAHKLVYILFNGSVPDKLQVCHSCDNSPCCNPFHLWLGTAKENMQDMHLKFGHHSKRKPYFTPDQVEEIRLKFDGKQSTIVRWRKELNISYSGLYNLLYGGSWKRARFARSHDENIIAKTWPAT